MESGEYRKWLTLVATMWIQAFTGTNFDFSSYSSDLKSVMKISQVQLNYLAVASDLGKVFGWSSGLALLCFPLWAVLLVAALMGLLGYGIQWLLIKQIISLPYLAEFFLCLLAGCSICWFNTVCYVLCIQNFPVNRALSLSLTISFNGISPSLYSLASKAISTSSDDIYLFLNAVLPLVVSISVLFLIVCQKSEKSSSTLGARRDSLVFLLLILIAFLTGLYILLLESITTSSIASRLLLAGAVLLLALPLCIPGVVFARERAIISSFLESGSGFNLVGIDELELQKELFICDRRNQDDDDSESKINHYSSELSLIEDDLGVEHSARMLIKKLNFWFYYLGYLCGATVGLVYINNLGQISQSLSLSSQTTALVTLYSTCSFFGRLLSAAPDFIHGKMYFARTGWMVLALSPMPLAFFIIAITTSNTLALHISTALIGMSSGFIFASTVMVTSELFGPKSAGVNHNILITNIPIGSLCYGLLAALIYDDHAKSSSNLEALHEGMVVCMGTKCYKETFVWWGCISLVGLVFNVILFLRTQPAYKKFEVRLMQRALL